MHSGPSTPRPRSMEETYLPLDCFHYNLYSMYSTCKGYAFIQTHMYHLYISPGWLLADLSPVVQTDSAASRHGDVFWL